MRNKLFSILLLYSFFFLNGSAYGLGEKTINLGASWEAIDRRLGIIEAQNIRPNPVLLLAGGQWAANESFPDLHLSFDEGRPANFSDSRGRYDVFISPELASARDPYSRIGEGAALFTGRTGLDRSEGPLLLKPRSNALFASGSHVRDFTIEFWLFPQNLQSGEQIFSLHASRPDGLGGYVNQHIQCVAQKNKLQWTFIDFFFAPGERERKSISLSGPALHNRTWSHHLIRFDSDLGVLEYLVDGRIEVIDYASSTGREGGDVFSPVIGEDCRFVLGGRFSGLMDEFRIYGSYLENAALTRYTGQSGRVESRAFDLGHANSQVLKVEAFGGRTSNSGGKVRNDYSGNGVYRFQDHAEMRFFIRSNNSPYLWNNVAWVPFSPGTELTDFLGRYVQLAVDFYPSGDGETSPYLSELSIVYQPAEPPPPPPYISAVSKDGAVELSWRASPSRDVGGYFVYYGTASGEYFGTDTPINVGNRTSVLIDGLNNGTLYYFAVAAYGRPEANSEFTSNWRYTASEAEPGEFSREVAARPLRMLR